MENINPIILAFLATLFTFSITMIGASIVFFFKKVNKNIMDGMLGFAAGVMIAASFFSMLSPAIEGADKLSISKWYVFLGFLLGSIFLFSSDRLFSHFDKKKDGNSNSLKRCLMLIFSITIHNIPEGLAVGMAFGSTAYEPLGNSISGAMIIALGIGLQNFPEGSAVSLPLRREGMKRSKAFLLGSLSGIVEPLAGILGAILVLKVRYLLPFLLSFAAGCMIYVVTEELIPESQTNDKKDLMAIFAILGFLVMMILDVLLG